MQKIICKRIYDTDPSARVKKYTYLNYGDPSGYEETLYQTTDGLYFIYTNGGDASPYPAENIVRLAKNKVETWLCSH